MRNFLFHINILKETSFEIPIINVGNLSTGGTGKTPMIEYLIRLLSQKGENVAVLSRGYGRKTKGFLLAENSSSSNQIGDEAFQLKQKFPNQIIAVSEKRVEGVKQLLSIYKDLDLILLDDAFQHRWIKAGFSILLTEFDKPIFKDFILPSGNLREVRFGAKRANHLIITKSPKEISEEERNYFYKKLYYFDASQVSFSYIGYQEVNSFNDQTKIDIEDLKDYNILLFTGIGNAKPLQSFLSQQCMNIKFLQFPDHHDYQVSDFEKVKSYFEQMDGTRNIILTTEKDVSRIRNSSVEKLFIQLPLHFLTIEIKFHDLDREIFEDKILEYVG